MKRFYILILALPVVFLTKKASGQTRILSDIIRKHSQAIGGADKWAELESYSIIMENKRETGAYEITASMKRPNMFRIDYLNPDDILIKSFDGSDGWLASNGTVTEMSDGEEKEMAEEGEFYEELAFSLGKNYEVGYLGSGVIDGKENFKIKVVKPGNDEQIYYVDAETFLINYVTEYSEDANYKGAYFKTRLFNYQTFESLVLTKTDPRDADTLYHELVLEPRPDSTVRQTWSQSEDRENWNIVFDAIYRPRKLIDN